MVCDHRKARLTNLTPVPGQVMIVCETCNMALSTGELALAEVYRKKMMRRREQASKRTQP